MGGGLSQELLSRSSKNHWYNYIIKQPAIYDLERMVLTSKSIWFNKYYEGQNLLPWKFTVSSDDLIFDAINLSSKKQVSYEFIA